MLALRAIIPGGETSGLWQWTRDGERVASVSYRAALGADAGTLTLDYTASDNGARKAVQCVLVLSSIATVGNGRRWFMRCPYSDRRARKLYKWNGIEQFCHRTAVHPRPTYASQRDSGSERIMRQRWAIRQKIGDTLSDLFDEPCKPLWMRWRTFDRYAVRDAELAAREGVFMARLLGRLDTKAPGDPIRHLLAAG